MIQATWSFFFHTFIDKQISLFKAVYTTTTTTKSTFLQQIQSSSIKWVNTSAVVASPSGKYRPCAWIKNKAELNLETSNRAGVLIIALLSAVSFICVHLSF